VKAVNAKLHLFASFKKKKKIQLRHGRIKIGQKFAVLLSFETICTYFCAPYLSRLRFEFRIQTFASQKNQI